MLDSRVSVVTMVLVVMTITTMVAADTCPCNNGGVCAVSGNCTCVAGTSGTLCEISVCTLNDGLCQNNGTCTFVNDQANPTHDSYLCKCTSEYSGQKCDQRVYSYTELLYWKARFDDLWNWTMKMGLPVAIGLVVILIIVVIIVIRKYRQQKLANVRSTAMGQAMDVANVLAGSSDRPITSDHIQVLVNPTPPASTADTGGSGDDGVASSLSNTVGSMLSGVTTGATEMVGGAAEGAVGGSKSTTTPVPKRQIRSSRRASSPTPSS